MQLERALYYFDCIISIWLKYSSYDIIYSIYVMTNKSLLIQKQEVYRQAWMEQVPQFETLKLKLHGADQKKLNKILADLKEIIKLAANNVTLAPDSGI